MFLSEKLRYDAISLHMLVYLSQQVEVVSGDDVVNQFSPGSYWVCSECGNWPLGNFVTKVWLIHFAHSLTR